MASTFSLSFTSFSLQETSRRRSSSSSSLRRRRLLRPPPTSSFRASCSSSSSPSEATGKKPLSEAGNPPEKRPNGAGDSQAAVFEAAAGVTGGESSPSRSRLVALRRRWSLWKRIFFASKKVRSIILLNIMTVIYASEIPALKEVEAITDPALFTMVRFVLSAIPFLPFIFKSCKSHIRSAGIELGFWVSLGYLTQVLGLVTSDAGRASFISAFTVIVVPLIDSMLGATVPVLTWSGALLSLIGVVVLECGGTPGSVGDIFTFMSAVFFGIHMLRTEHISRNTKKENFLPLLAYEIVTVALVSAIWFFLQGVLDDVPQFNFEPRAWSMFWDWMVSFPWIPVLYTGVFSTGLCLWAEMDAMRDVSATETAIIYGLEPVWGAAFAWFLLGERWGMSEWLGAALVLCGSIAAQILGSASENSMKNVDIRNPKHLNASKKPDNLSLSPVIIDSQKNAADLLMKKDKL